MRCIPQKLVTAVAAALALTLGFAPAGPAAAQGGASGQQIFVAPNGSGDASGRADDEPLATVEQGLGMLRPNQGDWLLLKRGSDYQLTRAVSAPPAGSRIAAYGPGDTPTLEVSAAAASFDPELLHASDVLVRNVVIEGAGQGVSPILIPGDGWDGPTPQPLAVGDSRQPGFDGKAIARWDVVPYQTFEGKFNVGVVAFHINEIDRVEFSVEGGPWAAVTEMTLNPRTGVVEYRATLDADLFATSDAVQARAIAWPVVGAPRVLELDLYVETDPERQPNRLFVSGSNGDDGSGQGTPEQPFASIGRAFNRIGPATTERWDIILMSPGDYVVGSTPQRIAASQWITIKAAEGLNVNDVVLLSGDPTVWSRPRVRRLRFEGVSFDLALTEQIYKEDDSWMWFSRCRWFQSAGSTYEPPHSITPVRNRGTGGLYVTDSLAEDALYGFVTANLVRNCHVQRISGDAYQNSKMVLNCTADDLDGTLLEHHTDVYQMWGDQDNLIVYGVNATNLKGVQGIFLEPAREQDSEVTALTNSAFVDIRLTGEQMMITDKFSQLTGGVYRHLLFQNVQLPDAGLLIREANGAHLMDAADVVFKNCVFTPASFQDLVVDNVREGFRFIDASAAE